MNNLGRAWYLILMGFFLQNFANAQSKISLEFKTGLTNTDFTFQGDFPELEISSVDNRFYGVTILKSLSRGLSYGLEFNYYRFDINRRFVPLDSVKNTGGMATNFWSLGPKAQYDLYFFPKFGSSFATSFLLNYAPNEEYEYQGGEFQGVRLENGDPRIPVKPYGKTYVEKISFILKPELSLFYELSSKSRVMITAQWGLDLREPSIVIDLDRIEFEDQTYQNKYFYSGNYFSALLGYRYTF
jgi:hypothetical protein